MGLADDPRIKELNEKIQQEKDPRRLNEPDELMKLIDEIQRDDGHLRSTSDS